MVKTRNFSDLPYDDRNKFMAGSWHGVGLPAKVGSKSSTYGQDMPKSYETAKVTKSKPRKQS